MLVHQVETLAHWHVYVTVARGHVNHAVTQARWHVDHVGTQVRMARDIANSKTYTKTKCHICHATETVSFKKKI